MHRAKETFTGHVGSDLWMPTSLLGIERKSAREPKHQFMDLYRLLNKWNLADSYRYLNKSAASGVDGVTAKGFKVNLKTEVETLERELRKDSYKARLVKRVFIDKANGKKRPLGLPVVRDKVLQTACSRILEAIYEPKFVEGSFGYRRNRGARKAVEYLSNKLNFGKPGYVLELDIKGFFDNIDHSWMIKMLKTNIKDQRFIRLIKKWLSSGVVNNEGEVTYSSTGTPQGGVISPVLCNIYLHYALDLWLEKKVKPALKGEFFFCRYADDVVCSFQYKADASKVADAIETRLKKFYLELSKEKTKLVRFSRFDKENSEAFQFLGFSFRWESSKKGKDIVTHRTNPKRQRQSLSAIKIWIKSNRDNRIGKFFDQLNKKLRGYYNYFGIIGNWHSLMKVATAVKHMVFKWLNRRSQKKSYTWRAMNDVFKEYEMVKPFIIKPNRQVRFKI